MTGWEIPSALDLTRAQFDGRACVWCGMPLWKNATSVGTARGSLGMHSLDVEVFACPLCVFQAPAAGNPPFRQRDDDGPGEGWPS